MPRILVARLLGIPLKERVAGSTLFDELSKRPSKKKIKVYFFGGQEGVAEKAYRALNKTSKGMASCGFYDPGFVSIEQAKRLNQWHQRAVPTHTTLFYLLSGSFSIFS